MDYKNTPEGRAVQSKYADLLSLSRPAPIKSRMTIQNRAKIFSPFAALRGYEDEIASEGKDHLKVQRIELSEEEKAKLSDTLCRLRKGQPISVRYFIGGYYDCRGHRPSCQRTANLDWHKDFSWQRPIDHHPVW